MGGVQETKKTTTDQFVNQKELLNLCLSLLPSGMFTRCDVGFEKMYIWLDQLVSFPFFWVKFCFG